MTARTDWAGEARSLLALAFPVILAQLGIFAMGLVDVLMVGRLGDEAIAAVATGDTYSFVILIVPLGILLGLDPIVSQAWGAGDRAACGRALQRGLVLSVGLSIPLVAAWFAVGPVLVAIGQGAETVPAARDYVWCLVPGALPVLGFQVLRQVLQAMGRVRPVLVAILIANVFHVLADWAFIYGRFGMPEMGAAGAGLATSLSRWILFLGLAGVGTVAGLRDLQPDWSRRILSPRPLARILGVGMPIGVQYGLEVWGFCTVTFLMGSLGSVEVAGHAIALKLASLTFMVPLGLSVAASVRVGHAIGRGDLDSMRRAGWTSFALGAGFMASCGAVFALFPAPLARAFTPDAAVVAMAATLLPIAAVFQVFDGLQAVGFGVLRGTGDTRFPLVINLIGYYVVGLPVGWLLTFRLGAGPRGLWVGLCTALFLVASLLVGRVWTRFRGEIRPLALESS